MIKLYENTPNKDNVKRRCKQIEPPNTIGQGVLSLFH